MQKIKLIGVLLTLLANAAVADETPPSQKSARAETIQVEVAPKGSPAGTKASWGKGKIPPPKSVKRRIREVLGIE